jgi:hypothetical protein
LGYPQPSTGCFGLAGLKGLGYKFYDSSAWSFAKARIKEYLLGLAGLKGLGHKYCDSSGWSFDKARIKDSHICSDVDRTQVF